MVIPEAPGRRLPAQSPDPGSSAKATWAIAWNHSGLSASLCNPRPTLRGLPSSPAHLRVSRSTWVVEIVLSLQGLGLLVSSEDLIEPVLAQDDQLPLPVVYLVLSQQLHDLLTHS